MKVACGVAAIAALTIKVQGIKVGFLGDSDNGADAAQSYKVMRDNGVEIVLQNGDFDYDSDPQAWDEFLSANWLTGNTNRVFLGTSGNHEDDFISTITSGGKQWETENGYKQRFLRRLQENESFLSKCKGRNGRDLEEDYGNFMVCETDEILLITIGWEQISDNLLGAGGDQAQVNAFLEESLANSKAKWKVCTWHRPEGVLNPGNRHNGNYGTEQAYNICTKYGAFITSGHSHVYGRSKLIKDFATLEVSKDDDASTVQLGCGQAFSVVTGMGGTGIDGSGPTANEEWMRKVYTSDVGDAKNGVLICDFGDTQADCQFLVGTSDRTDHVYDAFTVLPPPSTSECSQTTPSQPPTPPPDAPAFGANGCYRDYVRFWALAGPSKYVWCGGSCCAEGSGGPCYYTVPNPAECGNPSGTEQVISSRVRQGIDDVEEYPTGTRLFFQPDRFYVDSSDLEMVDDGSQGRKGQLVGLRFQGVEIPANAEITDAYIQFKVDSSDSGTATGLSIVGHKSTNSPEFTSSNKPSDRAYTSAVVSWNNIESWSWRVDASTYKRTASIKSIVQEIVNQQGWNSGNALSVIIKGGSGTRNAESFEGDQAGAPLLVVRFAKPGSSSTVSKTAMVAGITSSVLAVLGVAGVFVLRRRKFGAQLQAEALQAQAAEEGKLEARRPSL